MKCQEVEDPLNCSANFTTSSCYRSNGGTPAEHDNLSQHHEEPERDILLSTREISRRDAAIIGELIRMDRLS